MYSDSQSVLHVEEHAPEVVQTGVVTSVCLRDKKDNISWLFFAFCFLSL